MSIITQFLLIFGEAPDDSYFWKGIDSYSNPLNYKKRLHNTTRNSEHTRHVKWVGKTNKIWQTDWLKRAQ